MKEMNSFNYLKKGTIIIEIQSFMPEKFINLLWKNNIQIMSIYKKNITTMTMEINLKDYSMIDEIAKKTKTKIKVIGRKGLAFWILKFKRRSALAFGIIIFGGLLYYLSTFIWGIDISTEHILTPFEIREQLESYGVKPGINKKNINVYALEEKMLRYNENISWIRIRIEGGRLKVTINERLSPPVLAAEENPCSLVAKKDGQVVRVYTSAGTPVVKPGEVVKRNQLLVKGEQGKDGNTYEVHAKGEIIANTFYEATKDALISGIKKERTGEVITNYFITINNKKIYLKNSLNKLDEYDKIIDNKFFINKETCYKLKDVPFKLEPEKVINETAEELYAGILLNLDKTVKIIDKKIESEPMDDKYKVRVVVIAEENIAINDK